MPSSSNLYLEIDDLGAVLGRQEFAREYVTLQRAVKQVIARENATEDARTVDSTGFRICEHFEVHPCGTSVSERNWPCMCGIDLWKIVACSSVLFLFVGSSILYTVIMFTNFQATEMQTQSESKHVDDMARRLAEVKLQGRLLRLKSSGTLVVLGLTMLGVAAPIDSSSKDRNVLLFTGPTMSVGFTMLVSASLPTDTMAIRALCGVAIPSLFSWAHVATSYAWYLHTHRGEIIHDSELYFNYDIFVIGLGGVMHGGLSLYIFSLALWSPFHMVLHRLWICVGVRCLYWACVDVGMIAQKLSGLSVAAEWWWASLLYACGITALNALVCLHSRLRHSIRDWLSAHSAVSAAAAGVAELISHKRPEEVLAKAQATFLCVSADCLTREDLAENTPNPRLRVYAKPAELGCVDAFMSHSWHDDAEQKMTALQEWRTDFKAEHGGQEPTLWIDKYCIDQTKIEDSLACLPMYLAGCKKLFVLCGDTYLERLWCVVELFVFMEMCLDVAHFEVRMLGNQQHLCQSVQDFDVEHARCFTEADTIRLREVIYAGGPGLTRQLVSFVKDNFKVLMAPEK